MKSCEDDECVECRNEEKYRHQKCGPNRVNLYAPYGHADGHPLTDQIWRQTLKTRSLPELPEPYTKKLLRFATKRKPPSVATQDTRKPTSENRAAKTRSVAAKRKAPSMVEKKQPGAEDDFGWLKDLAAKKFKPAPETPAPSSSQPASSIPSLERILSDLTQALDEEEMETTPRGPARLSSSNNSEKRATSKPKRSRPLPSVKRKTPSQEESVIPRLSFATQTRMPARSSSPIESMDDDSRPISNIPRLSFKVGPPPSSKRLWEAVDSAMDGR
ncbi:hypothetical protein FOL47_008517 [Perkinsus chesapeaki]|uniref:Uncharacterized protein n=1 Tax=Perkinsus chesapeaki TaxID=330153 RepID=A0A7J6MTK3_PERCH|nr:hypothetical protein FOL47_008517 [Perkinsus chesapeaki]